MRRSVSHPLGANESQLPKFALHRPMVHVPAVQVAVAFANEHAMAHEPQCVASVWRLISQPLAGFPSQSAKPALHAPSTHAPMAHVEPAFGNEHVKPHAPQLDGSDVTLCSQPFDATRSQSPVPAGHIVPTTHAPPAQMVPTAVHATPQAPQLPALESRLVSQPFAALPSQSPKPALHAPSRHVPALHAAVAFAKVHTVPQLPQFAGSVAVVTHAAPQSV